MQRGQTKHKLRGCHHSINSRCSLPYVRTLLACTLRAYVTVTNP